MDSCSCKDIFFFTDWSWYYPGDNFFKTASYTIEALCTQSYEDSTEKLKDIEAKILLNGLGLENYNVSVAEKMIKAGASRIGTSGLKDEE